MLSKCWHVCQSRCSARLPESVLQYKLTPCVCLSLLSPHSRDRHACAHGAPDDGAAEAAGQPPPPAAGPGVSRPCVGLLAKLLLSAAGVQSPLLYCCGRRSGSQRAGSTRCNARGQLTKVLKAINCSLNPCLLLVPRAPRQASAQRAQRGWQGGPHPAPHSGRSAGDCAGQPRERQPAAAPTG